MCNGLRMVARHLRNDFVAATMLTSGKDQDVFIPLIATDSVLSFEQKQFPVRLAYAITINKSQEQTLKVPELHLGEPCYSHGQLM